MNVSGQQSREIAARRRSDGGSASSGETGATAWTKMGRGGTDEAAQLAQLRTLIDFIDRDPVNGNRWGAEWYAPGTYTVCPEAPHPVAIGGECQHSSCIRRRESVAS